MNETLSQIKQVLDGFTGVIVAVATLVGALASLANWFRQRRNLQAKPNPVPVQAGPGASRKARKKVLLGVALGIITNVGSSLVLLALSGTVVWVRSLPDPRPLNEQYTAQMWRHFKVAERVYRANRTVDRVSFEKASSAADMVISEFAPMARNREQDLMSRNVPLPSIGAVDPGMRAPIFQEGLVNDVGTCQYIKGRCLEYLGRSDEARLAYQAATNFPHARTWDLSAEVFWSPSEAALGRLGQITNAPK